MAAQEAHDVLTDDNKRAAWEDDRRGGGSGGGGRRDGYGYGGYGGGGGGGGGDGFYYARGMDGRVYRFQRGGGGGFGFGGGYQQQQRGDPPNGWEAFAHAALEFLSSPILLTLLALVAAVCISRGEEPAQAAAPPPPSAAPAPAPAPASTPAAAPGKWGGDPGMAELGARLPGWSMLTPPALTAPDASRSGAPTLFVAVLPPSVVAAAACTSRACAAAAADGSSGGRGRAIAPCIHGRALCARLAAVARELGASRGGAQLRLCWVVAACGPSSDGGGASGAVRYHATVAKLLRRAGGVGVGAGGSSTVEREGDGGDAETDSDSSSDNDSADEDGGSGKRERRRVAGDDSGTPLLLAGVCTNPELLTAAVAVRSFSDAVAPPALGSPLPDDATIHVAGWIASAASGDIRTTDATDLLASVLVPVAS